VAWRWRHVNSETGAWCYQHHQYETTSEYIEQQPLYAAPIQSSDGDVWTEQDIAEARAEAKVLYDYFHPSEPIAQGQREAIARIIDPTGFDPDNLAFEPFWIDQWKRRALAKADAILAALAPSAQEGETSPRTPKVRTSHHRNKEEAARLQALVNERLEASPHTRPERGGTNGS